MSTPTKLKFLKSHEWVEFTGETAARIGLSDFAQQALGGIVFVNLPAEGDALVAGESLGDVESVKAASDIMSPVSGTVSAVNAELEDDPGKINEDPYGAWLVEVTDITAKAELLDAAEYEAFCAENE